MQYPPDEDIKHLLTTKAGRLWPLVLIVGRNRDLQDEFKEWADENAPGCFDHFEDWFQAAYTWIELNEDRLRKMMN